MEKAMQINRKPGLLARYKGHPGAFAAAFFTVLAAVITVALVLFILAYLLLKGLPHLTSNLFAWTWTAENQSMLPALLNTVIMTVLSLLIATPLGVGAAIYMVEYAKRGNKLVKAVRITAETLSGIPSIVYGLFGMLIFVIACGWNYSLLSGALTLAIMVLPVIMRTTEEALIAVPDAYREGSFGLGAGRLRTVFRIILPAAMPGILSGIILSVGRITGETAALIFTAGSGTKVAANLLSSARTLSVHMYCLLNEGLYVEKAYATGVVLIILVVLINMLSSALAKRLTKR